MASDLGQAPPPTASLDPGLLRVIRPSAGLLIEFEDAFIRQLHADLVTMIPELAANGWAFCERMVRAVLWAATTDQPPQVIADGLRWVGAANWLEGFPDDQYVSVAHALVRAVHVLSESFWSASLGSAWISYFLWIKPHLMLGAQQEADKARAMVQVPPGGPPQTDSGDVDLESVGSLLDDEDDDDEDAGYGQIMVSMTRNPRRDRPRHPG
jgi:hypothetical protein